MSENDLLRHFYGGFVRLHILYHAAHEEICGVDMMAELRRHGYRLGPGTMYPILHQLQAGGYLKQQVAYLDGKRRKNYRITPKGRRLLAEAQVKLRELVGEVVQGRTTRIKPPAAGK